MSRSLQDRLVQGFLLIAALVFAAVGVPGLLDPEALLGRVGTLLPEVDSLNEARAMYGGFQLAVSALFLVGAFRPQLRRPLLLLWLVMIGGLLAGRFVSMAIDGPPLGFARVLLTAEIAGAIAGAAVLRLCPRDRAAS